MVANSKSIRQKRPSDLPVGHVAHLGIVVAHAEGHDQLREEFVRAALVVQVLDAAAATRGHDAQVLRSASINLGTKVQPACPSK